MDGDWLRISGSGNGVIVKTVEETIKEGGVVVIPSDTLYGIMGSARNPVVVEKIYAVRGRDRAKPFIVLISDSSELGEFGIKPTEAEKKLMERYWPGKVTIVFKCVNGKFMYLHRGSCAIALRVPAHENLRELIRQVGPLVAPSANPEGKPPAETIEEAKNYFGEKVDFYEDGGVLTGAPSTLVTVKDGRIEVLRMGAVEVKQKR